MNTLETTIRELAVQSLQASRLAAQLSTAKKNSFLLRLADALVQQETPLLEANARDLETARTSGMSGPMLDRLQLTPKRIRQMADGVREVAALPDPLGEVLETIHRPNGLLIQKLRVPIGVIGIIYESRPNVTIDCAALCFKSGNAAILRGGKEAFHSNLALVDLIRATLIAESLTPEIIQFISTTDRTALEILLKLDDLVHCIIPRGGEGLIRFVAENARMPVIKHYKGVCCLYLDVEADPDMAASITLNAKCQRPAVCNAIENLFVHQAVAPTLLPRVARALQEQGVELRGDQPTCAILAGAGIPCRTALESDYFEEYGALILAVKIVADLDEAIQAVNHYGSHHSDGIVTACETTAARFLAEVDSATVYWNASTRFTDGYEFGFGAEIGISTDKLHARGPMGLRELTTYKYIIRGTGQVRV